MYLLYSIYNNESGSMYIGMTSKSLAQRWSQHKHAAKIGKKSKLYDAMRKYGMDVFSIAEMSSYPTKEECCIAEIEAIKDHLGLGENLYNLAKGGEGGFNITNVDEWKKKLSASRQGGKPFLGKSHTEEAKRKCGEASRRYHQSRTKPNELG